MNSTSSKWCLLLLEQETQRAFPQPNPTCRLPWPRKRSKKLSTMARRRPWGTWMGEWTRRGRLRSDSGSSTIFINSLKRHPMGTVRASQKPKKSLWTRTSTELRKLEKGRITKICKKPSKPTTTFKIGTMRHYWSLFQMSSTHIARCAWRPMRTTLTTSRTALLTRSEPKFKMDHLPRSTSSLTIWTRNRSGFTSGRLSQLLIIKWWVWLDTLSIASFSLRTTTNNIFNSVRSLPATLTACLRKRRASSRQHPLSSRGQA